MLFISLYMSYKPIIKKLTVFTLQVFLLKTNRNAAFFTLRTAGSKTTGSDS